MEVYVDDMLVKSKEELSHLNDLRETFATLKQYQMKLNPVKCVFGVASGKYLGFMVSQRGIEANQRKCKPSSIWLRPRLSKKSRSSQEGSQQLIDSSLERRISACLSLKH